MSIPPFRFIQAGDFHLDRPPAGIAEVPEHLRLALADAAYRAATRVIELALAEKIDFLLLTGDLVHAPSAGPRGWHFLLEQFERLQKHGIRVYWCTGRDDAALEWPTLLPLPANVERFDCDGVRRVIHERDKVAIAEICGCGFAAHDVLRTVEFSNENAGLFTIALAHGKIDAEQAPKQQIDYWALGGDHERRTVFTTPVTAHYAGSPQGRSQQESGPHGCTLVEVDEMGQIESSFLPTDIVRYQTERIAGVDGPSREALDRMLNERAQAIVGAGPELLVTWIVAGRGATVRQLRRGAIDVEMLNRLRNEWGKRQPSLWSLEVLAEPVGDVSDAMFEEESLRGEYLRLLRDLDVASKDYLDVKAYLPERFLVGNVPATVAIHSPLTREKVLRDAALLGIDLLSGEEGSRIKLSAARNES